MVIFIITTVILYCKRTIQDKCRVSKRLFLLKSEERETFQKECPWPMRAEDESDFEKSDGLGGFGMKEKSGK